MKDVVDLSDNDNFGIALIISVTIFCVVYLVVRNILKKKGVDIDSNKNTLKLAICLSPIIFTPIFYDTTLSIKDKIIGIIIGLICGFSNFYGTTVFGKKFRKTLGIETKGDIEEREREEKAKKEKEEKGL